MRKHLERELDTLAEAEGLTRGQLLELSAPDLGLDESGRATFPVAQPACSSSRSTSVAGSL